MDKLKAIIASSVTSDADEITDLNMHEILNHLHRCKSLIETFYGREEEIAAMTDLILGDC